MNEPKPVTYRMLHEEAAGMPLEPLFFILAGVDPDAPVTCNCHFNEGHEVGCDIVAAHALRARLAAEGPSQP